MTTSIAPKINPAQATALIRKIVAYKRADRARKKAKAELDTMTARYRDVFPIGTVEMAGYRIRRWIGGGGETFSLKDYKAAGHAITPEMASFVGARATFEVWDADPVEGPPEP